MKIVDIGFDDKGITGGGVKTIALAFSQKPVTVFNDIVDAIQHRRRQQRDIVL
jgi:hypothetical protein